MRDLRTVSVSALVLLMSLTASLPASATILVIDQVYLLDIGGSRFNELYSTATAISSTGEVVGSAKSNASSSATVTGFYATPAADGTYKEATLFGTNLARNFPNAVNADGVIAGQARTSSTTTRLYAYKGNPANAVTPMDGTRTANDAALGINQAQTVVGYFVDTVGNNQAFVATAGSSGLPSIQALKGAASEARAINDQGIVAGVFTVQVSNGPEQHAFTFDSTKPSGPVQDLGTFGGTASEASALNGAGDVVGSYKLQTGRTKAYLLKAGTGALQTLATPTGFLDSFAKGVNAHDWVVGQATGTGLHAQTALLWADGQVFDLTAAWAAAAGTANQWSELSFATGINDSGWIVGQGLLANCQNNCMRAFVLHAGLVPEPEVYLMLVVGLVAVGSLRIHRLNSKN
jgi:hypothetical protein